MISEIINVSFLIPMFITLSNKLLVIDSVNNKFDLSLNKDSDVPQKISIVSHLNIRCQIKGPG